jgi:hypothetical protein
MTGIALLQGVYFLVSGAWSLVHIESFLKVTGPKTDLWLVKTVGALLVVIGAALILAGLQRTFEPGLILVALGSAGVLCAIDVIYVARRVIPRIYLVDAVVEAAFVLAWTVCALER